MMVLRYNMIHQADRRHTACRQGAILGLPLDVANQTTSLGCSGGGTGGDGPDCGNINMELFWEVWAAVTTLAPGTFTHTAGTKQV